MAAVDAACKDASQDALVIVEGHTLLSADLLLARASLVLFLQADQDTCLGRRISRRQRSDAENQEIAQYFRRFVWPAHQSVVLAKLEQLQQHPKDEHPHLVILDGSNEAEAILSSSLTALAGLGVSARKAGGGSL